MSAKFAGVLLTRTKMFVVVHTKDLCGEPKIGHILMARWHGSTYEAKVVCVGSRKYCESPHILIDAGLVVPEPEICERKETPHGSEPNADGTFELKNCIEALLAKLEKQAILIEELSSRLRRQESLFSQELQKCRSDIEELLRRVPMQIDSEEDSLSFACVPRERLEALRKLRGGNVNRFALDLEKEVYVDQPEELAINIAKRAVFKYYQVPVEAREQIWRGVRNALDSRARSVKYNAERNGPSHRSN
ncbi:unnamed protein product [Nippostrongylus brasiliensis]|uniref:BEN domain-containing protein n=1 Tax=Nippostrongylus brasiliensis TaxID=27835 RepID=A0A0N4XUG1_NIPBR|nr:unnamed protein product [Nippostrongylus brasiliensis]